jgi:hypothetical protein
MDLSQAIWAALPALVIAVLIWLARRKTGREWRPGSDLRRFPKNDVDRLLHQLNGRRSKPVRLGPS